MTKESYSKSALDAMHRASKQALEKAANMDLKIPEWKDGKIIFVDPREKLKKWAIPGLKVNYPIPKFFQGYLIKGYQI